MYCRLSFSKPLIKLLIWFCWFLLQYGYIMLIICDNSSSIRCWAEKGKSKSRRMWKMLAFLKNAQFYDQLGTMVTVVVVVVAKSAWTVASLQWPRLIASLHTSAGGQLLSSWIWSSHRLLGRPGQRFHDESGSRPSDNSTWQCRAWWAGTVCGILAMCPKMELSISQNGDCSTDEINSCHKQTSSQVS